MGRLWLYDRLSRLGRMGYKTKIMVVAFLGTHVPLAALAIWLVWSAADPGAALRTMGVTLVATFAGAIMMIYLLDRLLAPVDVTAAALRAYRTRRSLPSLPVFYADRAGRLMADAQETICQLDASLVRMERVDSDSGALNRSAFLSDLVASPGGQEIAVVRVANFDRVAAGVERSAASLVMRTLVMRLSRRLGPGVSIARIGDADLAWFSPCCGLGAAAERASVLRREITDLSAPVSGGGVSVTPILHGALSTCPPDKTQAQLALDHAITAVSVASDSEPVTVHSPALRETVRERFRIEEELRAAIAGRGLDLHFQPVVDAATGVPTGAEALLRWNSPTRGQVPPSRFIPVAEATGLIEPIGLWVLREACRQVAGWDPGLRVAINLGARQFMDEDLAWHVDEAVQAAGINHDRLEIELTESVAMADHDHTRKSFARLRDRGIGIAIDDFGTGYASMSTLRRLPFTKLKIDREFVTDVHLRSQNQAICAAIIALGKGLGLDVLGEGTEQREEVDWLAAAGCDLFQGFYFARPMPATLLTEAFARLRDAGGTAVA